MFGSFFRRVLSLFFLLFVTFVFIHMAPGGPFDGERKLPPEIKENLEKRYGLEARGDQNFLIWVSKHFVTYLKHLKNFSLGPSLKHRDRDVGEMIFQALPVSAILGFCAFFLSLFLAVSFSLFLHSYKLAAVFYDAISRAVISLPLFLICILMISFFALSLDFFPAGLWGTPSHVIMPVICLSIFPVFYLTDLMRDRLSAVSREQFIIAARAKGLSAWKILIKHKLRVAGAPVVGVLGPIFAQLMAGSFVVETVFGLPGLGRYFVQGIMDRDLFLVQGITLTFALILMVSNDASDLLRKKLDPR